jgi:hypothetical protein
MELAFFVGAVACVIGWHWSRVHMSHRGIPVRRRQLHAFRRDRTHHLIWFFVFGILFVLIYLAAFSIR